MKPNATARAIETIETLFGGPYRQWNSIRLAVGYRFPIRFSDVLRFDSLSVCLFCWERLGFIGIYLNLTDLNVRK